VAPSASRRVSGVVRLVRLPGGGEHADGVVGLHRRDEGALLRGLEDPAQAGGEQVVVAGEHADEHRAVAAEDDGEPARPRRPLPSRPGPQRDLPQPVTFVGSTNAGWAIRVAVSATTSKS
jgi:hypothetical protein